jgi:hypothetical protein
MHLEGPVDVQGWKTLIAAMPAGFSVQALTLSMICLDAPQLDLLFEALRRMPKLQTLALLMCGVEGAIPSERSDVPAFEALETMTVLTSSESDLDVCWLPLVVLGARQLRRLSIEHCEDITADQHELLARALGPQTLLNSLTLVVKHSCSTAKQLERYVPFLCGQAPLTALHLDGWELEMSKFNLLLAELQNKPALTSLSLCNFTFLKATGSEPVQISSLARLRRLLKLDLGWNCFGDGAMGQLLDALNEEQTCLMFLSLNGNSIGSKAIAATAALLNANRTLQELSFQPGDLPDHAGWDDNAFGALAEAFNANTSLLRFRVRWSDIPKAYHARLVGSLERNKDSFALKGMWGALNSVHSGFPEDVAKRIFEQGLTRSDSLSMSSANKAGWVARRRGDGPSK